MRTGRLGPPWVALLATPAQHTFRGACVAPPSPCTLRLHLKVTAQKLSCLPSLSLLPGSRCLTSCVSPGAAGAWGGSEASQLAAGPPPTSSGLPLFPRPAPAPCDAALRARPRSALLHPGPRWSFLSTLLLQLLPLPTAPAAVTSGGEPPSPALPGPRPASGHLCPGSLAGTQGEWV